MPKSLGELEQMILLAVVALGDGAYGASIRREVARRTGREVSAGGVYTVLERLESAGLVSSRVGAPTAERGGRRRRHYALRPDGVHALDESLTRIRRMSAGLDGRIEQLLNEAGS